MLGAGGGALEASLARSIDGGQGFPASPYKVCSISAPAICGGHLLVVTQRLPHG